MASYVMQKDIKPITAKKWLMDHWQSYDVADSKEEFLQLLNILQACGENLDTLHDVYLNGATEFCDIFHNGRGWESDREIAATLYEFCTFYTEKDFIEMILDRAEDYESSQEWSEEMRLEASDDPKDCDNDCQITKTEDGYVRRIWC